MSRRIALSCVLTILCAMSGRAQVDTSRAQVDTTRAPADSAVADTPTAVDTTGAAPDSVAAPVDTAAADSTAVDSTVVAADTVATDSVAVVSDSTRTDSVLVQVPTAPSPSRVIISSRVDTSNVDVRRAVRAWLGYLDARADGSDGRQFWYPPETKKWDVFNLSARWMFASQELFEYYRPTVMSADRATPDRFVMRTLFYSETRSVADQRRNPWAITRLFVERDPVADQWWVRNALGVMTEGWMRSKVRFITFVYPPGHRFNLERAARAVAFCDSVSRTFPFFDIEPFEFYMSPGPELQALLLGIEYHLDDLPATIPMISRRMLFSCEGSEFNGPALVAMVVGRRLAPHPIVRDGFTGWVGGWGGEPYAEAMREVALWVESNRTVTFDSLLHDDRIMTEMPGLRYAVGAVVCDMAYMMGGVVAVQKLFTTGGADEALYVTLRDVFGVGRDHFDFMWRSRVRELR